MWVGFDFFMNEDLISLLCLKPVYLTSSRGWGWGWIRRGEAAFLLWLCYALPDSLLEGAFCLCAPHGVLPRLGLLCGLHPHHRHAHRHHRGPSLSLRLHNWAQRFSHSCCICGIRHLCARWEWEVLKFAKRISPGSNDPHTLPHLRSEATGTVGDNQFTCSIPALLTKTLLDRKTEFYQGYGTDQVSGPIS